VLVAAVVAVLAAVPVVLPCEPTKLAVTAVVGKIRENLAVDAAVLASSRVVLVLVLMVVRVCTYCNERPMVVGKTTVPLFNGQWTMDDGRCVIGFYSAFLRFVVTVYFIHACIHSCDILYLDLFNLVSIHYRMALPGRPRHRLIFIVACCCLLLVVGTTLYSYY
jgi:hypothetical protein